MVECYLIADFDRLKSEEDTVEKALIYTFTSMNTESLFYFAGCVSSMIQFMSEFEDSLDSFAFTDYTCHIIQDCNVTHVLCSSKHSTNQPAVHSEIVSVLNRLCMDVKSISDDEKLLFDIVVANFMERRHTFLHFQPLAMIYNRPFLYVSNISLNLRVISQPNFYGCIAFYKDRCIYTDFHPTWSFMIFCLREEISKRKLLAVNVDSDLQTSGSPVTQVSLQSMHVGDILLIGCFDLNYEFSREDVRKTLAELKTEHIPPSDPPEYEQFDWALFEESYGGVVGTNTELFDGPVEKDYYYSSKNAEGEIVTEFIPMEKRSLVISRKR